MGDNINGLVLQSTADTAYPGPSAAVGRVVHTRGPPCMSREPWVRPVWGGGRPALPSLRHTDHSTPSPFAPVMTRRFASNQKKYFVCPRFLNQKKKYKKKKKKLVIPVL